MNVYDLPSRKKARLITSPVDVRVPTEFQTTDATTALTRGVAEYIAFTPSIAQNVVYGRTVKLQKVFDAWAEPEDDADYPAICCYTDDNVGEYEPQSMSPSVSNIRYPDGSYEISSSVLRTYVWVELWATDPEQRQIIVQNLENGFEPFDWMGGFRLELPHYFNQRATFDLSTIVYKGSANEANPRFVNAVLQLRATVPVTRNIAAPAAKVQPRVSVGAGPLTPPSGVPFLSAPGPTGPVVTIGGGPVPTRR